MKVIRDIKEISSPIPNPVITIGNFDGVHLGHQRVIKQMVDRAKEEQGISLIYTFKPHTRKLLNHERAPLLINTKQQKIELLSALNPDYLYISEFNHAVAAMKAEEFVEEVLVNKLNMKVIYFSTSFAFGHQRKGNISLLNRISPRFGFEVVEVKPITIENTLVNSTIIREMIASGKVEKAAQFMGREFFIDGAVVPGENRGKQLGYPTANIQPENELIPGNGIYLSKLKLEGKIIKGLTNVGIRPTFNEGKKWVETYLFNFNQKIYGSKVRIFFLKKIRDEKKFEDSLQLSKQIEKDIQAAHSFFSQN